MTKFRLFLCSFMVCVSTSCYAIDQTEIVFGTQKAKVINGKLQIEASGSSTVNVGTITAFENTLWVTSPPIKAYEFTMTINPAATSTVLFTIGTPIAEYRAYIEYITLVRDEPTPINYLSIQLIDMISNKLLIGGEIVPANTQGIIKPPLPLLATDLKLLLLNKSFDVQIIKICVVISVRKVTDYIFGQPY